MAPCLRVVSVADNGVQRVEIAVPEEELQDLAERVRSRRSPMTREMALGGTGMYDIADAEIGDERWAAGTDPDSLEELMAHWENKFDWRAQEAKLNELDHFLANIDGSELHFIHQRSANADAIPLLLIHGWPGSVCEFQELIPKLVNGNSKKNFHVVAPSLPGFAWSVDAAQRGLHNARTMAKLFVKLMAKLGYSQFVTQGGDWGSIIGRHIAVDFPQNCVSLHLNMAIGTLSMSEDGMFSTRKLALPIVTLLTSIFPSIFFDAVDRHNAERMRRQLEFGSGYFLIQATRPHLVGAALNDSPIALTSWLLEKFHAWTDYGATVSALTNDQMLTDICIYWFTNCAASSLRMYFETASFSWHSDEECLAPKAYCATPTGVSFFPAEVFHSPKAVIQVAHNLVWTKNHEKGGHFAAWEQPDLLAEDLREFFHEVLEFDDCKREALQRRKPADSMSNVLVGVSTLVTAGFLLSKL